MNLHKHSLLDPLLIIFVVSAENLVLALILMRSIPVQLPPVQSPPIIKYVAYTEKDSSRFPSLIQASATIKPTIVFLGDSITQGWETFGKQTWDTALAPLNAADFGINNEQAAQLQWHLEKGKLLGSMDPKLFVMLIGTNDLMLRSDDDIVEQIGAVIAQLRQKRPQAKVLLLGIFPRGGKAYDPVRSKITAINNRIKTMADKNITYLDVGSAFLDANGNVGPDILFDGLHLTGLGYQLWANAMLPTIKSLIR